MCPTWVRETSSPDFRLKVFETRTLVSGLGMSMALETYLPVYGMPMGMVNVLEIAPLVSGMGIGVRMCIGMVLGTATSVSGMDMDLAIGMIT